MGKTKKASNSINVHVGGHADGSTFTSAITQHIGGVEFNLGEDADNDADSTAAQPDPQTLALFQALSSKFTLEELETVCWELGIVFEDLPAKTLSGKARQLLQKANDLSLIAKLIALVNRDRPNAES